MGKKRKGQKSGAQGRHGEAWNGLKSGDEAALAKVLPGVEVIDFTYTRRDQESYDSIKSAFKPAKKAWLESLANVDGNKAALQAAGFKETEIESMAGGKVPNGYSVHHIKPKDDGGDNSWSNFVLISRTPEHDAVHAFVDPQKGNLGRGQSKRIRFPNVQPGIYPPVPGLKLPVEPGAPAPARKPAAPAVPTAGH